MVRAIGDTVRADACLNPSRSTESAALDFTNPASGGCAQ